MKPGLRTLVLAAAIAALPAIPASADTVPVTYGPNPLLVEGAAITGTTVRGVVDWDSLADTGVCGQRLQVSVNRGAYTNVPVGTGSEQAYTFRYGVTYRFRVMVAEIDEGSTEGDCSFTPAVWDYGRYTKVTLVQENSTKMSYFGSWRRVPVAGMLGGYVMTSKGETHSSASLETTGVYQSLWVTNTGPNRGEATLTHFVADQSYERTIDTYSPVFVARASFLVTDDDKIGVSWLTVAGTPGRPRVDLDAVVVLKYL